MHKCWACQVFQILHPSTHNYTIAHTHTTTHSIHYTMFMIYMSRQTKCTNTHTPKNTPHILPGKAVSAFEFAYSDKRQVPKNASVSSLLGQWRLSQYLSFSKNCGGVTQEFTLSHHSRLGEIPIYYLSFFVSYNTCFVLDKDKDGLLLVVETSGSYFFFWPLSKLQVAREGQRPQSLRLPTIVTMISQSLWTPWWLIIFF